MCEKKLQEHMEKKIDKMIPNPRLLTYILISVSHCCTYPISRHLQ